MNEWFGKDFLQTKYELGVDNLISSTLTTDALETALEEVVSEKYQEWDEARARSGESKADVDSLRIEETFNQTVHPTAYCTGAPLAHRN